MSRTRYLSAAEEIKVQVTHEARELFASGRYESANDVHGAAGGISGGGVTVRTSGGVAGSCKLLRGAKNYGISQQQSEQ